jgi:hypothetical protein
MASNVTRDNLKGYFNTGDQPTESNFEDLIDSNLNITDGGTVTGNTVFSGHVSGSSGSVYLSGSIHNTTHQMTLRGAGALTGSAYSCKTANINGETITTILVDIEGMKSKNDEGDVIGIAGTTNSYLMKWQDDIHGVCYKLEMACIEAPTGGTEDIDLRANSSATATYDTDGSAYTALITTGEDWTIRMRKGSLAGVGTFEAPTSGAAIVSTTPANNDYLYLVAGDAATDGVYTAGKFIIKLYGVKADFS